MNFAEIAKINFNRQYHNDAAFHAEVHRLDAEWPMLLQAIERFAMTDWQKRLLDSVSFKVVYLRLIADSCAKVARQRELVIEAAKIDMPVVPFDMDNDTRSA